MTLLWSSPCICSYRRRIIARNFHKATRNADSSLGCLLCPASILSLLPSADCVLLWTAISSRLFSSTPTTTLSIDSLCLLWDLTSLVHCRSRAPALYVGFAPKQIDPLGGTNTNGNECYPLCHSESNSLETSINSSVASRVFTRTRWMVRICDIFQEWYHICNKNFVRVNS